MGIPKVISRTGSRAGWAFAAVLLLACGLPGQLAAAPRAERHELRHEVDKVEAQWRQALLQGDAKAMSGLLADDYIGITNDGTLLSKDDTLADLSSGALHFDSIQLSDRKIRFYGATALVTSRADVMGKTPDGPVSGSFRYTRVYVRDAAGVWHIVSFEASRIRAGAE
jgi:ketosteroid isomerase-like protein